MEPVTKSETRFEQGPAISVARLSKNLGGQQIIADVSFEIAAGEMLVALLASRAGTDVPETVRLRERQFQDSGLVWASTEPVGNGAGSPRRRNGAGPRSRKAQGRAARGRV